MSGVRTGFALGLLVTLLVAGSARAYDSKCYVHPEDAPADPSRSSPECTEGPGTARNRWIGERDEHRQIFARTMELAGLPEVLGEDVTLRVFTSADPVDVAGVVQPSLIPVELHEAVRVQERTF